MRPSFVFCTELLLAAACATAPPAQPPALHLAPCTFADVPARCGTFDVPEAPGSSRMLALKVIVVPATERNESPIFAFSGGPGVPEIPGAEGFVKNAPAERRLHDLVIVDERGTGESSPLVCPASMRKYDHDLIEGDLLPLAWVRDCLSEIEANADPAHYTFHDVARDTEALRRALGYGPINVIGLSAGTRAAVTYESLYPKSVRAMLLYGPLPPENLMPLEYARDTQAAFDKLVVDCHADAACSTAFPRFEAETEELMEWLGTHPPVVESGGYHVRFGAAAFAEFMRSTMYEAAGQAYVPLMVHLASEGEWDALAPRFVKQRKAWYDSIGAFISASCPMDVRYIDRTTVASETANTLIGDYRVRRQIAACELWTPGREPRVDVKPSKAPVLIVTGDLDPVTPPRWADVLAKDLRNARVVIVKNTGHVDTNECTDALEIAFVDAGSFANLDDRCAQSAKRPPFATKLP